MLPLVKLSPGEVLPLVVIKNKKDKPQVPRGVVEVIALDGRMIHGTTFWIPEAKSGQMFFCPKEGSKNNAQIPVNFEGTEPLKCNVEPIPNIRYLFSICGADDSGRFYG